LAEVLKRGLPEGVTLLISAIGCDQRRALFKVIEKVGEVLKFDAPEAGKAAGEEDIAEFITGKLRAENKRFLPGAMEAFRELVEPSMRELANELEKLCIYVGKRADITVDDVRAICSASRQAIVWELVDALSARQLPRAINAVEKLLASGDAAIGLVALLVSQFRLILLAHDLMERRLLMPSTGHYANVEYAKGFERLTESEKAHFPRSKDGGLPNAWRLYRCALAARNFSTPELIRAMDVLLEAHRQLVTTQVDDRLILEEALVKIALKKK
jgi:DNA polymerase III delta subunit